MKITKSTVVFILGFSLVSATLLWFLNYNKSADLSKQFHYFDNSLPNYLTDVPYGSDSLQKMDVYLPPHCDSTTGVIIIIHGGGWFGSDKADVRGLLTMFAKDFPECAVVNLNYRLATVPSPAFPKQPLDVGMALKKLQCQEFNLSKNYFLYGSSAGGHIAMLYAYAFDTARQVRGVFSSVAITDLTDPNVYNATRHNFVNIIIGEASYPKDSVRYALASPVSHLNANSPPTIAFYGIDDTFVPVSQRDRLEAALAANGVRHKTIAYHNTGHIWSHTTVEDCRKRLFKFIEECFGLRRKYKGIKKVRV